MEGREYAVTEILDTVERDEVFSRGGGGLTVSGGEPLMQPKFLSDLLTESKRRHIHAAMETCGHGDYAALREAAKLLDLVIYDIKSLDDAKHREFTGLGNSLSIENSTGLCDDFPNLPKLVRTPVIPGFNDSPQDIGEIAAYLAGKPGVTLELLPYHRFGAGKYAALGREYPMGGAELSGEIECLSTTNISNHRTPEFHEEVTV
jgi:pyruvate formate lyase activating enzyme